MFYVVSLHTASFMNITPNVKQGPSGLVLNAIYVSNSNNR